VHFVSLSHKVVGLLTLHSVKSIPATDWLTTTAAQVMIPVAQIKRIQPEEELVNALGEMDRDGVNQLPVMVGDQIQGVLGRDDVIGLLRNLTEFSRK
jgi:predicted transcriptional regulator